MIPAIHGSKEKYLGLLNDAECCYVIEERNGMFELELTYNLFSLNWDKLIRGNIIIAHANDTLLNQKFRIYKIGKTIRGKFSVFAKHISYDMQRDMIEGLDIQNQSCEYCLNEIFRNSKFSQKFRGYSDIINAQDYKIGPTKLLSAIGGTKGSILDTFGTGAELLRDNENIHVLNRRGHDNGITIEYSKNLTGLDITEDEEGLITRIRAIAKYTPEGGEETTVATYVDSSNIDKYETPFTETIDFSNKFENGEIPTTAKLEQLALVYFRDNQCDVFKGNYKIQFIPLSKCAGYEDIEDKISLCDTVHIKDYRYNLDDKAKIIKVTYDTLKERYVSMEVGVPRSSLSDVISNNSNTVSRDEVKDIINNSTTKFPNTLPSAPVLSYKLYGFSNIELSWTFENKVYYQYELYASKTKNFTPNVFDIIHAGQSSSFLFQAKPNETWYFRCCAVNSHGNRTKFSDQVTVKTVKIDDLSNYVDNMAIGDALIGELNLGRGWFGQLKGNYIDARRISVTDGNGKRTLDIDSFGNVSLDVAKLNINSKQVYTGEEVETKISQSARGIKTEVNQTLKNDYATISSVTQTANDIRYAFKEYASFPNLMPNGCPSAKNYLQTGWTSQNAVIYDGYDNLGFYVYDGLAGEAIVWSPYINVFSESTYSIVFSLMNEYNIANYDVYIEELSSTGITTSTGLVWHEKSTANWKTYYFNHTMSRTTAKVRLRFDNNGMQDTNVGTQDLLQIKNAMLILGSNLRPQQWYPRQEEINSDYTIINKNGVIVRHNNRSYTQMSSRGLEHWENGMAKPYHYMFDCIVVDCNGKCNGTWFKVQLPSIWKGKDFTVAWQAGNHSAPYGRVVAGVEVNCRNKDILNATVEVCMSVYTKGEWAGGSLADVNAYGWCKLFLIY